MSEENNNQQPTLNVTEDKFQALVTKEDVNSFYKFISRVDLKGQEVPEFNKLINIFMPQNLKKVN
jgi:hypothetical protein